MANEWFDDDEELADMGIRLEIVKALLQSPGFHKMSVQEFRGWVKLCVTIVKEQS